MKIKDDDNIRVVVITGNGKFFCTGMDLGSSNQAEMAARVRSGFFIFFGSEIE